MPFYVPPVSRRSFLAGAAAAGAGCLAPRALWGAGEKPLDPHHWALISDPHIWEKRNEIVRKTNMAANLEKVCAEIVAQETLPGTVLCNGDCAYKDGLIADYQLFVELTKGFKSAGIAQYLTLGNHDQREHFWEVLKNAPADHPPVEHKFVQFVAGERANWIILDSLDQTNKTPGLLGEKQLAWLAKTLDAHADHPTIVTSHHHPESELLRSGGLIDTKALLEILLPRKQVKALMFGHTHRWSVSESSWLHLINLPPVGYLFVEGDPNGWANFHLRTDGATLELHALDKKHPLNGDKHELKWRT
jgi:3',5'-cyclic AMP phosphodiesterase CpdA